MTQLLNHSTTSAKELFFLPQPHKEASGTSGKQWPGELHLPSADQCGWRPLTQLGSGCSSCKGMSSTVRVSTMTEQVYTSALMRLRPKGSFCAPQILSLFICLYWVLLDVWKGPLLAHPAGANCSANCCAMPPLLCHTSVTCHVSPDTPCWCAMTSGMFILLIWSVVESVLHPRALVPRTFGLVASCTIIFSKPESFLQEKIGKQLWKFFAPSRQMDSCFNYSPHIPTYKASQDTFLLSYNTLWTRLTLCICEYICMHSVKLLSLQAAENPTCYSASWLVCWPAVNVYKNVIMIERPTDMTRTLKKEACLDHSQNLVAKKCLFNFEKSLTGTYEGSQLNVVYWSLSELC